VRGERPTLDDVSAQLIDPGVCNVDNPPRLPTRLGDAAVAALALAYRRDPEADFDDAREADVLRAAGDDRCARGLARLARVHADDSAKAREAADEAVQLAELCGDDRMRAEALVAQLAMQVTPFLDPKLQKGLAVAEAAVHKVAQPDLVADLDLVKAVIASASGQWDETIRLVESAIRGFGDQRPLARLDAVLAKVRALRNRREPRDLEAARTDLARWRADAERSGRTRLLVDFDALDVDLQWALGDVAGANARYPELLERIERVRKHAAEGKQLAGTVVDARGKPVAGALVAAGSAVLADSQSIGYVENFGDVRIGRTDAQGRFRLAGVPDKAVIVAQHGDLRSIVRTATDGDRLVLQPTTTIRGRVIGPDASRLTVFVVHGDRDRSPMYQLQAPVAPDGSFSLAGAPIGRLRIGAARSGGGIGQAIALQDLTVGPSGATNVVVKTADRRKLRVLVRSAAETSLSGAQVFVASGTVAIKTVKELQRLLHADGLAIEIARPITGGETPPELGKLLPGDMVATFTSAPAGAATACAIGLSGDLADPEFRQRLQRHVDELELRCVPVAPEAKAVTIEVPPMKRLE
jgi:hypothetical protein